MKTLRTLALAAALSAGALQAHALSVDWDTHGNAEVGLAVAAAGQVVDSFLFRVGSGTTLSTVAVANNLSPVFHLDNGLVQLFRAESGPDTMLGMFSFDGTTGEVAHTFSSLVAGSYYYLVTGLANGTAGAVYALTSTTVANVAEPAQLTLFLAGLVAAGAALRRRRPT